jgi:pimeloyl-ACP methyl ester carboxylesterase
MQKDRADPAGWLRASGVEPAPARIEAARSHLAHQPAATVSAMAKSVVEITAAPEYLDGVMTVLNNGTRVHLIAGERSREGWDVPAFVLDNADLTLIPDTGHLLTIESPQAFADALATLTQ